ncbi:MAG: kinase/pyrophosphorylase [Alphaproteobacteria bacterium]|nr:kinase/pyrophosphorylase [Alphaproteobacteria bacterium]
MSDPKPPRRPVFLVSGGTGNTARSVLQAALRQFGDAGAFTRTYSLVREEGLEDVFRDAQKADALVIWTLVGREARSTAEQYAKAYGVRHVDVLGPLLDSLEGFLDEAPRGEPGLLHRADERYYQRIAAIEFTLAVDDGRKPHLLAEADVVLVGVSRTGKTPLSTYLAHRGLRVANQPLVLEQEPPEQLYACDPRRIFALTIDPGTLQRIRTARLRAMKMPADTNYCDMGYILAELEHAERIYRGNRWPVIDVSNRAIEETASFILRRLEEDGLIDASGAPSLA